LHVPYFRSKIKTSAFSNPMHTFKFISGKWMVPVAYQMFHTIIFKLHVYIFWWTSMLSIRSHVIRSQISNIFQHI
jgi:hypothetical protein